MEDANPPPPEMRMRELELERYKATLDYRRAIIISGFVAIAIALIPPLFQLASAAVEYVKFEHQLKLDNANKLADRETEAQKFRSQYVSSFLEKALNQDIELRLRLAEYFKHVAQGTEQTGWKEYYDALLKMRNDIRDRIDKMESDLAKMQQASQRNYAEEDRINDRLRWLRGEVGYVAPDKSVIRDPRSLALSSAENLVISLESVAADKREIADKIISGFAKAGLGIHQQTAALAEAIVETDLNPAFKSRPPEESIGLFPLNRNGGFGTGYTVAQLMDPDTNISIVVAQAKKISPFVNASTVDDAVETFVRLVMRPPNPTEFASKVRVIAQQLVRKS